MDVVYWGVLKIEVDGARKELPSEQECLLLYFDNGDVRFTTNLPSNLFDICVSVTLGASDSIIRYANSDFLSSRIQISMGQC